MKQFTSIKLPSSSRVCTLLSCSNSMTFSMTFSSFPWPQFQLSLSKIFKTILVFGDIFTYVIQLNRHKLWCPTKRASFALFDYVSLSYFVLALTSTVTNLPNIILQFSMNFHDRQLNSMTFQAWKIKFLNFMTFQVFHDLYEPCHH